MRMHGTASGSTLFGGNGFSVDGEILPAELLNDESVLAQLANVFFRGDPTGAFREPDPDPAEFPGVTDFYQTLVEQIPAVVFIAFLDSSFGRAYVSPQIEQSLGFTQEEWLNDPVRWYRQIHPDDKERWSGEVAKMFLTGEPLVSVYRVLSRTGNTVWFRCEVRMVRKESGHPWFIHGVGFDITDLKNTEEALTASERMLSGIFEYAPDTMVVVGSGGLIERANAQVMAVFGYEPDELIGQPVEVLIPERFRGGHVGHRRKYDEDRHLRPMGAGLTLYGRKKDASEFPVEIMLSPVATETGEIVIAVIRDVTRRQEAEQALREYAERMKVLSKGLIDIQESERRRIALELHDQIGQMLTGLKLKLEMITRSPQVDIAPEMNEAQEMLNDLLMRTRELSLDLRPATLDHLGLLSALLRHLRVYTSQTDIAVDFEHNGLEGRRFSPELETAAFRVVQEALTNIARHSGSSSARVRIIALEGSLSIEVADDGVGFEPESVIAVGQSNGLTGMRERALLLGGTFAIESGKTGTKLSISWTFDERSPLAEVAGK